MPAREPRRRASGQPVPSAGGARRPAERRSWKAPAAAGSQKLLIYRRALLTTVCVALVGLFAWLIASLWTNTSSGE